MKIYFIIAFFILLNAFFIISDNNLHINNMDNTQEFFIIYVDWFQQIGNNINEITGEVIHQTWIPE